MKMNYQIYIHLFYNKLAINQCKSLPISLSPWCFSYIIKLKRQKFSREITRSRRKYWASRSTLPGSLDFCAALVRAINQMSRVSNGIYSSKGTIILTHQISV